MFNFTRGVIQNPLPVLSTESVLCKVTVDRAISVKGT